MATIDITRSYNDTELLVAQDFDNIVDETKTFLNTTRINNDNTQDGGIDASTKLTLGSLSSAKIVDSNVTSTKLAESPDGISAAKINDLAVTTAKINDLAVTTAKINDLAVTQGKLSITSSTFSSSSGSQTIPYSSTISDANFVLINNSTIYVTFNSRPVLISVQGANQLGKINSVNNFSMLVALFRNETIVSVRRVIDSASLSNLAFVEMGVTSGTYGYSLRAYAIGFSSAADVSIVDIKLQATEF
jgi:hypothetical protein